MLIPGQGSIEIRHADGSISGAVSSPVALAAGDEIRVPPAGQATVRFADSSEVRLGPSSLFVVRKAEPKLFSMFLNAGKLWASVTKNRARRFEVHTPTAVASVRGTEFSVEVKNLQETIALVRSGLVAVQGLVEGRLVGSETMLEAGHMLSVIGGNVGMPEIIHGMLPPVPSAPGPREAGAPKVEDAAHAAVLRHEVAHEVATQMIKEATQANAISSAVSPQAPEGTTLLQSAAYQQSANAAVAGPKPSAVNSSAVDAPAAANGPMPPDAASPKDISANGLPAGEPGPLNGGSANTAAPLPPPGVPGAGGAPPVQNTIIQPPPPPLNAVEFSPLDPAYATNCPSCPR